MPDLSRTLLMEWRAGDRSDMLGAFFVRFGRQQITRDLLPHEFIERFVLIEGAYHVVAETPGMVANAVVLESLAFAKSNDIEPMATPTG